MKIKNTKGSKFSKKERLRGRKDIKAIFLESRQIKSLGLKVLIRENGFGCNRILITAKRGFRTAVARNQEKRWVREFYRTNKHRLQSGYDLAVVLYYGPYPAALRREALDWAFTRAGLYK